MPCPWVSGAIADEDVWRVSPTTPRGVMVDDLDRLLFEKLNVRIKIEKQEKVTFQGGFERRHRLRSGIRYQTCETASSWGPFELAWKCNPLFNPVASNMVKINPIAERMVPVALLMVKT